MLNFHKKGLNRLLGDICLGKVEKLILTHRDRLLRFGFPLLERLCGFYATDIVILHDPQKKSFEEEPAGDLIEIISVFSSRLYGRRSHANRRRAA